MISKEQAQREMDEAVAKAVAEALRNTISKEQAQREKDEAVAKAVAKIRYEQTLAYRSRKIPCRDYATWREQ